MRKLGIVLCAALLGGAVLTGCRDSDVGNEELRDRAYEDRNVTPLNEGDEEDQIGDGEIVDEK